MSKRHKKDRMNQRELFDLDDNNYQINFKKKQKYPPNIRAGSIGFHSSFKPLSKGQEYYVSLMNECDITLCQGPAGCGKTWIATRVALEKLINNTISRIIVTKPILEAGSEKLGHLPGEVEDKVLPHFQSILDAFEDHIGPSFLKKLLDNGKIQFLPTAFCRGRNLHNAYILIDEAQNLTKKGIKLLLTRIAEGSIMTVNGDTDQIDLPYTSDSGFVWAINSLIGKDPKIGVVTLDNGDIQRHPLIATLLTNLR